MENCIHFREQEHEKLFLFIQFNECQDKKTIEFYFILPRLLCLLLKSCFYLPYDLTRNFMIAKIYYYPHDRTRQYRDFKYFSSLLAKTKETINDKVSTEFIKQFKRQGFTCHMLPACSSLGCLICVAKIFFKSIKIRHP